MGRPRKHTLDDWSHKQHLKTGNVQTRPSRFASLSGDVPAIQDRCTRTGLRRVDLGVFAKPPAPGTCKTRLIPHLGASGAAAIANRLAQATARTAAEWQQSVRGGAVAGVDSTQLWLWLAGEIGPASAAFVDGWPAGISPHPQVTGDLGARLTDAASTHFSAGAEGCLLIGTDCPALTCEHLAEASRELCSHDVVLGPAIDGGYTLIGMSRFLPELFQQMPWSTDRLLAATRRRMRDLGLRWYELQTLGDVDIAEDLPRLAPLYRRPIASDRPRPAEITRAETVSVVIPSRGDSAALGSLVRRIRAAAAGEVDVVVVVAEPDAALAEVIADGARVVVEPVPRGVRLNAGAALASGKFLFFLHADAIPPDRFDENVRATLSNLDVALGAFSLSIEGAGSGLRWIERGANWRSRVLGLPYGDQGLFCRAEDFWRAGGFPAWPLLDDVDLVRRLGRLGRSVIVDEAIVVSARRWDRLGVVRTTMLNQAILAAWLLGGSPERLAQWYRGKP